MDKFMGSFCFTSPAQTATILGFSSFDAVVAQLVEQLIRNQ
jgi:hypothetical protein